MSSSAVTTSVAGLVLVLLGVLVRRTDVAVLGVPLVLSAVWCWSRRPQSGVDVRFGALQQDSQPGVVAHDLGLGAAPGVAMVLLRTTAPGHRPAVALLSVERPHSVGVSVRTVRTGERAMFAGDYLQVGADAVVRAVSVPVAPVRVTVLPAVRRLGELPLPFRLQGLTGPHDSRRPGDGGDLRDINLFAPGDRLRRIDWRATVRRSAQGGPGRAPGQLSDLYVRRTFATADATVMLVLDSRDDVGPDVTTWGDATAVRQDESTSLDIARTAAASLARRYLDAGDRVGFEDLGRLRRPVPPAGGRQQLPRLVRRLALAQPEGEPKRRKRAPRLPSGALIIIFSTFLDDDPADLARSWRHAGHRVLAVDVLPPMLQQSLPPRVRTAFRMVTLERRDRLLALARTGVEVLRWAEDPGAAPSLPGAAPSASGSAASPSATAPDVDVALRALARLRGGRR